MTQFTNSARFENLQVTDDVTQIPTIKITNMHGSAEYQFPSPAQLRLFIEHMTTLMNVGTESAATTAKAIYSEAIEQQSFELRIWKEGYGEGFTAGYEAGYLGGKDS